MAKRLPCLGVREVDLHHGHPAAQDRVPGGHARVSVGHIVRDYPARPLPCLLNGPDDLPSMLDWEKERQLAEKTGDL